MSSESHGEEITRLQQDFKGKMEHIQKNLEISNAEVTQWKEKYQSNAEQILQLNENISTLNRSKDDTLSRYKLELDNLQANFSQEKSKLDESFQKKIQDQAAQHKRELEESIEKAIVEKKKIEEESAASLQSQLETKQKEQDSKVYALKLKAKSIVDNLKSQME